MIIRAYQKSLGVVNTPRDALSLTGAKRYLPSTIFIAAALSRKDCG